jgi:tellurite resistance protein TerB
MTTPFRPSRPPVCWSPRLMDGSRPRNQRLDYDLDEGVASAEAAVRRVSDRPDAARLVIETACAVADADGGLDGEEREVILHLCEMLGLDPAAFDLVARSRPSP